MTEKKDLYKKGKCGQGYEDDRCVNCTWVMGLALGLIACGKGMLDSESRIMMLGRK